MLAHLLRASSNPTPEFIGVETNPSSSTSMTVNVPSGVQDGDLLVYVYANRNAGETATPSGTWDSQISDTTDQPSIIVKTRIASSEPASYTITASNANYNSCAILAYRHADTVNTVGTLNRITTATSTATATSITPTRAGALLAIFAAKSTLFDGATPSGMAVRVNFRIGTSGGTIMVADLLESDAGATGNKVGDYTASDTDVSASVLMQITN